MFEADLEIPIKVLIVGNGAVGKSSMIQRYCKGIYTNDYKKTIGVDFLEKKIRCGLSLGACMRGRGRVCLCAAAVAHCSVGLQSARGGLTDDDLGHGRARRV
jgi:hypothetical protein